MAEILNLGNRVVNNWLLRLNGRWVLIDTGYAEGFPAFLQQLQKHGLTPAMIDDVFLTHAHDDHAGFLDAFLAVSPARVILHANALPVLRRGQNSFNGGSTDALAGAACVCMKLLGHGAHRFPPLRAAYESRLSILMPENRAGVEAELGARILDTPGHTSCSISLCTADGLLFCGDAAMNGFPSRNRVTVWAENLAAYQRSWALMIAQNPRLLYPGHGKPFPPTDLQRYLPLLARRRLRPLSGA